MRELERFETVGEDARRGGIWRVWNVDGVTVFTDELDSAEVTVTRTATTDPLISDLALNHERGHVSTVDAMHGNDGDVTATYDGYPRFQHEVEAWIRGCDEDGFTNAGGAFALDCLNTYRRSLGTDDDEWTAAQSVIASMGVDDATAEYLARYEPMEPDPTDPPPDCMGDGYGEPMPEPDSGDEDGDGSPEPEGSPEPDPNDEDENDGEPNYDDTDYGDDDEPEDATLDVRWMEPEPFAAVEDGEPLSTIAARYGLDPNRIPPLIRAMQGNDV